MIQDYQRETVEKIIELKKSKQAIILAHNYQLGEIQDIADFTGDSLELSIKAQNNDAQVIVFCGVTFMAETAAILSPEKSVLLPVLEAGCPMADMADADALRALKATHPQALAVCYVNSTAEVKAECDLCCTSANAAKIINALPQDKEIIFLPDKNLGMNVETLTGRKLILWPGFCPTHMRITAEHVIRKKTEFPSGAIIAHPECRPEVTELADAVLSTGGMIRFARESEDRTIIVATELGLIYRLQKENPDKTFISVSEQAVCMNMKMINLEDVLNALEEEQFKITVPQEIAEKAIIPIQRMINT